jgi:tetratricopeptide (TPR) repeat protein
LGRALHLSGEFEDAERILQEAVATSPADRRAFAYFADTAERLGHHLAARDALLSLTSLEGNTIPHDADVARARRIGRLSLLGGDSATAARQLRRAVDAGQTDASTLAWFAEAQWALGEREGARATLARAAAVDEDHADVVRASRTIR